MTEREKVIYSLERCICHVPDACRDCAYDAGHPYNECVEMLLKDAMNLLKDGDTVRVTRCAGCRYWAPENDEDGDYSGHCKRSFGICYGQVTDASWFCADGEREG